MEQIGTKLYIKVMEGLLDILFALSLSGDEWVVEPRVAKFLKNAGLILTLNLRVFEVFSSKNHNPFCLKNLKTFTLSLRNAALILTSVFEGFQGLTSNENFRGSSKNLKFLSKFYSIFQAFLVNFSRFFEDSSKKP